MFRLLVKFMGAFMRQVSKRHGGNFCGNKIDNFAGREYRKRNHLSVKRSTCNCPGTDPGVPEAVSRMMPAVACDANSGNPSAIRCRSKLRMTRPEGAENVRLLS